MTIIAFNRQWTLRWHWVLVNVVSIAILLSLSYWQWQRATLKQQSLDQLAQWQLQPVHSLAQLLGDGESNTLLASDGAQVAFTVRWVAPFVWLLDNQIVNGRAGYDVLIPVQEKKSPEARHTILLNLGWVAAPPVRAELPQVQVPAEIHVQGIYRIRADALLLGKNLEDHGRWPMRIQKIDPRLLAGYLSAPMLPGVIYQQQNSSFIVHYRPVVLPPERHRAYALQWLLLSIAALLVGVACAKGDSFPQNLKKDTCVEQAR